MEIDLRVMKEKTAQAVREIIDREKKPLISMSMLFFDIDRQGFNFKTFLAIPHDQIPPEQLKVINQAFEYIHSQVTELFGTKSLDEAVDRIRPKTIQ